MSSSAPLNLRQQFGLRGSSRQTPERLCAASLGPGAPRGLAACPQSGGTPRWEICLLVLQSPISAWVLSSSPDHPSTWEGSKLLLWPCPGALSCLPTSSPSLCQPVSCLACPPSAVFMSCSWVFLPCHVVPAGISAWVPNRCRELHVAPPVVESLGVGVQQGPSPRRHGERAGFGGAQRASQPQHSQPCDLGPVTGPLGPSFPSPRTLGTAGRRW